MHTNRCFHFCIYLSIRLFFDVREPNGLVLHLFENAVLRFWTVLGRCLTVSRICWRSASSAGSSDIVFSASSLATSTVEKPQKKNHCCPSSLPDTRAPTKKSQIQPALFHTCADHSPCPITHSSAGPPESLYEVGEVYMHLRGEFDVHQSCTDCAQEHTAAARVVGPPL